MENEIKPQVVQDNVVVTMHYQLKVDGELYDASEENDPLVFLQGHQNIIPGLEKELYGLKIGETKEVQVDPKNGYGEIDKDAIQDVDRAEFPSDIPLEPGVELEMKDQDGNELYARIVSVSKDRVKLDFNEPLAGKELDFRITIIDLREATAEEVEHGHAHFETSDEDDD
jgi:FKBP-type peptidyl-prolyl cis-trans isomerase SlyD